MFRKMLVALLAAPLLFTACKKESNPANEFVINGVHDVNLGTTGGNILALAIAKTSGVQEPVTISVTDLPSGIVANIQPASGTPDFGATITFSSTGAPTAGTYPIHVVGASASYKKTYDLNLIVPALNGFIFDGVTYNTSSLQHATNSFPPYGSYTQILISSTSGGTSSYVNASFMGDWPSADGNYTYRVGGMGANGMAVEFDQLGSTSLSYSNTADSSKMATLKIAGGKATLTMEGITMENNNGSGTKSLTVNAKE